MKPLSHFREELSGLQFDWPIATLLLFIVNFISWCAVAWFYHLSPFASQNSALLLRIGAVNSESLHVGQWWRIITSQFLHVHFLHLCFNMLALLLFGCVLEREFRSLRLVVLYLGSGMVGQIAGVVATPLLVSTGSSQAIMGLAGGMLFWWLRWPQRKLSWLAALLSIISVQVALDLISSGGIKIGHLAGFCAGIVITYVASHRAVSAQIRRARPNNSFNRSAQ
jgi:rhomboid protease GluP